MAAMISNLMYIGFAIIFNFCVDTDFQRYGCHDIKFNVHRIWHHIQFLCRYIFSKDMTAMISNLMCIGSAAIFSFYIDIDFSKDMTVMISNLMCIGYGIIFNFCIDTDFQRYGCHDIKFNVHRIWHHIQFLHRY